MRISVIGLGKLGSPILAVLASKGYEVVGVDTNPHFVDCIHRHIAPVSEPLLQGLLSAHSSRIRATSDYADAIAKTDATLVIVPTPSGKDGCFSNDFLCRALEQIGAALKRKKEYHLIVIKSTVMPGSTGGILQEMLEKASGRIVGPNLGLCYSPEFIALGNVVNNLLRPDLVLIGESDEKAGDLLEKLYRSTCENEPIIRRMNFVNAELSKIAINTYVTTKISYANMLSDICQRIEGADVDIVTQAVGSDSRIGSKYLKGGTGFGGPCFPRDNIAFEAFAQKLGARADLAQATRTLNDYQTHRLHALIEGNKIAILGLAYKPGTYVVEESQGIQLANQLSEKGYSVSVYDPMALNEAKKVLTKEIQCAASTQQCFQWADTLILMTPWPEFAREITPELARDKRIIDCWRLLPQKKFANLIYLGYGYSNQESLIYG